MTRGHERLRRFLAVAGSRTWADAADVLGTTPVAVRESMSRLETLCGGALFADNSTQVRLTSLGKKLRGQAGEYLEASQVV